LGTAAFAVAEGGVYYAACGRGPDTQLHRLDLATGKDSVVGVLDGYRRSLAVSPDGKIILYTSQTGSGSDLMLVEGFQ
jgi:Tol biopolymer transport system component